MAENRNNDDGKNIKKASGATVAGAVAGGVIGGIPGAITGAVIAIGASIIKAMNDNK